MAFHDEMDCSVRRYEHVNLTLNSSTLYECISEEYSNSEYMIAKRPFRILYGSAYIRSSLHRGYYAQFLSE
jgi:hypothetical protein